MEYKGLADSILGDITRIAVRETITAQIAGLLQGAFAGGGFGLFHEGGVVGESPPDARYADPGILEHALRYHGGGFVGSGLLPDEVPIIARRGELLVPPERIVHETMGEQRPIHADDQRHRGRRELIPRQPAPDRSRDGARH